MKKSLVWKKYSVIFWVFVVGSFVGFLYENGLAFVRGKYALRQGLIYEPLIPIYGIGAVVFYFIITKVHIKHQNPWIQRLLVFFLFCFCGGAVEFITSYLQEKIFGTISWNYSALRFDIMGRTSLYHSIIWGFLGTLGYLFLYPFLQKWEKKLTGKWMSMLTILFTFLLVFDCSISILACHRQSERRENIRAQSKLDFILDERFPDERLNKIFNNAKVVKKENKS